MSDDEDPAHRGRAKTNKRKTESEAERKRLKQKQRRERMARGREQAWRADIAAMALCRPIARRMFSLMLEASRMCTSLPSTRFTALNRVSRLFVLSKLGRLDSLCVIAMELEAMTFLRHQAPMICPTGMK